MKLQYMKLSFVMLLAFVMIFTCTNCAVEPYACEVLDGSVENTETVNNHAPEQKISIGSHSYNVQYASSSAVFANGTVKDKYEVKGTSDQQHPSVIKIDSKTKEVTHFSGIAPYPAIENIDQLSDDEIKSVVEQLTAELADYSIYNEFTIYRPSSTGGSKKYRLHWQVKREILCNIGVEIYITSSGVIERFSKTDNCPDDRNGSLLPDDERDRLLEEKICEHLDVKSMGDYTYEIVLEELTYYKNQPAVVYGVLIIDSQGFCHMISLVIYEKDR